MSEDESLTDDPGRGHEPGPDGLRVIDGLDANARVDELCALYEDCEWWADRERAAVEQALAATDVQVGLVDDRKPGPEPGVEGRLVAHARVLSDFTYYGRIHDVIVAADRRGEGLGERLLRAVVAHPDLAAVSPTLLVEPDTTGFYERCGFEFIGTGTDWQTMVYRRDD